MRIVVFCGDLGIRVPGDKGSSVHLTAITRAFAANGHDVLLIGVEGHGDHPFDARSGVRTMLVEHPGRATGLERELTKVTFTERLYGQAFPVVTEFAPHVIYERLSLFGTAGRRLAEDTSAHHVVEVNALMSREEATWRGLQMRALAERRELAVLTQCDLRVAVSEGLAAEINLAAPGRPTVLVPNGVDADAFATRVDRSVARRSLDLPLDVPIAAFTGRLRPWHGVDVAIDALAHTEQRAHLVIAGDGEIRSELEARVTALGLVERVHWLGQITHTRIPHVLAASDVALAPYPAIDDFAFSPLKLYEYLAAGVPVVASDIGQIHWALDGGRFGRLVRPGDPRALACALDDVLLEGRADARDRADSARIHALRHHSWRRRAQQIIDRVEEALGAMAS